MRSFNKMDTEQQNNQQRGNEGNNDPASSSFDQRALTFGAGEDTASAQSTLETVGGATEQTSAFIRLGFFIVCWIINFYIKLWLLEQNEFKSE